MRNLKIMGVAVVAVLAMSAMVASAASAASYKSETATTYITGVQEGSHTFTAGAKVVCTGATGKGEFTSGATSITATNIAYTGCTVAGQAAVVTMNGCDYDFEQPTGASSPFTISTITLTCPSGKDVEIHATTSGCKITVKPQTFHGTSTGTNSGGSPQTVIINANIVNINYEGSGGICGGSGSTGTYSGKFKVSGFRNEKHTETTGIFIG